MKRVIVVKIGGSVLTNKQDATANPPIADPSGLNTCHSLCHALLSRHSISPVLVCGAGTFGHPLAKRYGFSAKPCVEDMTVERTLQVLEVHRSVHNLAREVEAHLCKLAIPAMAVAITKWEGADAHVKDSVEHLLRMGVVPIFYGDMQLPSFVLSGDVIAPLLATLLQTNLLFVCSYCVHLGNPATEPRAPRVTQIDVGRHVFQKQDDSDWTPMDNLSFNKGEEATTGADVTGAMFGKLGRAIAFCEQQQQQRAVIVAASRAVDQLPTILDALDGASSSSSSSSSFYFTLISHH